MTRISNEQFMAVLTLALAGPPGSREPVRITTVPPTGPERVLREQVTFDNEGTAEMRLLVGAGRQPGDYTLRLSVGGEELDPLVFRLEE